MGLKEFYKKIRYRLSRDYCYDEMDKETIRAILLENESETNKKSE